MRTLVVSDLHLGARGERDVLRLPEPRRRLCERLRDADQVVLLGDVVELRGLPANEAFERAGPALREIGRAAGDARVAVVPGNHDHRLAGEWLEARRHEEETARLGLEQLIEPSGAGLAARLREALGASEMVLAYPGLWLRPDVYAIHGHYLDCHNTIPTLEAIAISATARIAGGLGDGRLTPDDYEGMVSPLYAFDYELAQGLEPGRGMWGKGASIAIWRRLAPADGGLNVAGKLLGGVAIPGAIAALNRAGLGPFRPELSARELRRAALRAMAEVVERLGIEAQHVVLGHTHRAGPLRGDADGDGWALPGGGRLWNGGSWVLEPTLIRTRGPRSPYWPGNCVVVEDDGPPRLERLLEDLPTETLDGTFAAPRELGYREY